MYTIRFIKNNPKKTYWEKRFFLNKNTIVYIEIYKENINGKFGLFLEKTIWGKIENKHMIVKKDESL